MKSDPENIYAIAFWFNESHWNPLMYIYTLCGNDTYRFVCGKKEKNINHEMNMR